MATVIHNNFRNAQLGVPANSTTTVDFDADDIDVALLDATDSGAIDASTENYGEVDGADVVADRADSSDVPLTTKTIGSVATGVFDADSVTFDTITGDAADYLVLYKYRRYAGERDDDRDVGLGNDRPARDAERRRHHRRMVSVGDH